MLTMSVANIYDIYVAKIILMSPSSETDLLLLVSWL